MTILSTGFYEDDLNKVNFKEGEYIFQIEVPQCQLNNGIYTATIRIIENRANHALIRLDNILCFEIHPKKTVRWFFSITYRFFS